jgi:serine/threonine protein kinase
MTEGPTQTTKMYMAPEVFAEKPRDSASDVYSLGCVFLELLFALELKKEIKICILSKEIRSLQVQLLSSLLITNPRAVLAMHVLSMVAEDPSARATAATIASSLCEIPMFRCEGCSERNRWNWNPAHGKYYTITLCPGGMLTIKPSR